MLIEAAIERLTSRNLETCFAGGFPSVMHPLGVVPLFLLASVVRRVSFRWSLLNQQRLVARQGSAPCSAD
jgi:hypothetical protein